MSESKPFSPLALAVISFLERLSLRILEDQEADLTLGAVGGFIKNAGLVDGFDEVSAAFSDFHRKPQYCDLPDHAGVLAYLAVRKAEVERQAKVDALARRLVDAVDQRLTRDLRKRHPRTVFYMFHVFHFSQDQLVRYFGEEGAKTIVDYFAAVGLIHGEPFVHEFEVSLRQMDLWRDPSFFDAGSSPKP